MNDQHGFSRRSFMGMTLTMGSGLLLPWRSDATMLNESVSLLWFDPARSDARGLATTFIHRGMTTLAITGDRIRFARQHMHDTPVAFAGVTDYADFILLSGCAMEVGYRLVKEYRYPATNTLDAQGALVFWTMAQRRSDRYFSSREMANAE